MSIVLKTTNRWYTPVLYNRHLSKHIQSQNAHCLQGMPYSPVKFTGLLDAHCLQWMPYSPVKFTGLPDAHALFAGDALFPVKFTGAQMPNVCRGCRIPR